MKLYAKYVHFVIAIKDEKTGRVKETSIKTEDKNWSNVYVPEGEDIKLLHEIYDALKLENERLISFQRRLQIVSRPIFEEVLNTDNLFKRAESRKELSEITTTNVKKW